MISVRNLKLSVLCRTVSQLSALVSADCCGGFALQISRANHTISFTLQLMQLWLLLLLMIVSLSIVFIQWARGENLEIVNIEKYIIIIRTSPIVDF